MRILVLSTAVKNAGDYLITSRTEELLKKILQNVEIDELPISNHYDDSIEKLNSYSAIIIPGGPVSVREYPNAVPLCSNLDAIKVPLIGIGLGWYGTTSLPMSIYHYIYTESTQKYLHQMEKSIGIACRDWYTVRSMKNCNIHHISMTGCPAWYNLQYIDSLKLPNPNASLPRKISISDPAEGVNGLRMVESLIEYLIKRYPNSDIHFVFHRGIKADKNTGEKAGNINMKIEAYLKDKNIQIHDISYSADGMKIYDDCDLHVGFRVHAHIYQLSHGGISVLIEEDGRGAGVNHALGLERITAYIEKTRQRRIELSVGTDSRNPFFIKELDDWLNELEDTHYMPFEEAFRKMQFYYEKMKKHIVQIAEVL